MTFQEAVNQFNPRGFSEVQNDAAVNYWNARQAEVDAAKARITELEALCLKHLNAECLWMAHDTIMAERIQALESSRDAAVAEARLIEANWWEHLAGDSHAWHEANAEHPCPYCVHIAELAGTLESLQQKAKP